MLIEEEHICTRHLQLVEQSILHNRLLTEVQEFVAFRGLKCLWEVCIEYKLLLSPSCQTIRIVTATCKIDKVVQLVLLFMSLNSLLEESAHQLIFVNTYCFCILLRNKNSCRIVLRIQMLRTLTLQCIVEVKRVNCILTHKIPFQRCTIVVTVRSYGSLLFRISILTSFKRSSHVLSLKSPYNWNIANK